MSLDYRPIQSDADLQKLSEELKHRRVFVTALQAIFGHAQRLGTKGVILESGYIDHDYRDEFANVYAKCFRSYSDRSLRVHFFACSITNHRELTDAPKESYLGYSTLRPVEVGIVGRTVLQPWDDDRSDRAYALCATRFHVHLDGVPFQVKGAPFIEQDGMAITCAQSSMWMALRYISATLPMSHVGPYEISSLSATESPFEQRVIPSSGLVPYSMVQGFKNVGMGTVFELKPQGLRGAEALWEAGWDPVARIYANVESKIPAIVLLSDKKPTSHAATVVGHLHLDDVEDEDLKRPLARARKRASTAGKAVIASHNWVDAFIIHDDQRGPYRLLPVNEKARTRLGTEGFGDLLTPLEYAHVESSVSGVIAPLPEKVYLTGNAAKELAVAYLTQGAVREILRLADEEYKVETARDVLRAMESDTDPVVLRTYFIRAEKFKAGLQVMPSADEAADGRMTSKVREAYLQTHMPTYVWLVEITTRSHLKGEFEKDRHILGEMILDATANQRDPYPFIMCHFPGVVIRFDREGTSWEGDPEVTYVAGDKKYRHYSRLPVDCKLKPRRSPDVSV